MPEYSIRGLKVVFPYEAYPLQRKNALLESPTGTGKTLCLLCATVAWRQSMITQGKFASMGNTPKSQLPTDLQVALFGGKFPAAPGKKPAPVQAAENIEQGFPPILYASRTHSQLQQAMREVKKMNIGYDRFQRDYKGTSALEEIGRKVLDIEELGTLGRGNGPCPYYLSREVATTSDIVFLPYNYLIEKKQREHLQVKFENSIVIFDEGHNIEDVCAAAPSFEMLSSIFANCRVELDRAAMLANSKIGSEKKQKKEQGAMASPSFTALNERCKTLQKSMKLLEDELLQMQIPQDGKTYLGKEIFSFLSKGCILEINYKVLTDALGDAADLLAEDSTNTNSKLSGNACSTMKENIEKAFDSLTGAPEYHTACRVHFRQKKGWKEAREVEVAFWCFSPAVAMRGLCSLGMASVIVTSGTLSPMGTFASELRTPFPVRLENKHVIKPNQAWVGVVPTGPIGHPMDSSYKCREDPEYKEDFGNAMVNFARVIPDGILVFFPSYIVMQSCLDHWRRGRHGKPSITERIMEHKHVVVEPKEASLFQNAINDFKRKVHCRSANGCVFFSVCRGKVSEGLDFADSMGRAVIVCGIPFAQKNDPQVTLKREVLDQQRRNGGSLNGTQWYTQTAVRAVNQAMGRVIRHKDDYGAIIMCDRRFGDHSMQKQVSAWLRDLNHVHRNFGSAISTLTTFFKDKRVRKPLPFPDSRTGDSRKSKDTRGPPTGTVLSLPSRASLRKRLGDEDIHDSKKPKLYIPLAREAHNPSLLTELTYRSFGSRNVDPGKGLLGVLQAGTDPSPTSHSQSRVKREGASTSGFIKREEPSHWREDGVKDEPLDLRSIQVKDEKLSLPEWLQEMQPSSQGPEGKEEQQTYPLGIHSSLEDKQEVLAGLGSEAKTRSTRSNDSIVKIKPKSEYRAQLDLSAKDLLGKLKAELSLNQYKQILVALSEYKKTPVEDNFVNKIVELLGNSKDSHFLPSFAQFLKNKAKFTTRLRAMGFDLPLS